MALAGRTEAQTTSCSNLTLTSSIHSEKRWLKEQDKGNKMAFFTQVDEVRGYTNARYKINKHQFELWIMLLQHSPRIKLLSLKDELRCATEFFWSKQGSVLVIVTAGPIMYLCVKLVPEPVFFFPQLFSRRLNFLYSHVYYVTSPLFSSPNHASHNGSSVALLHTKAIIKFPQVCACCLMDYRQMQSQATVPRGPTKRVWKVNWSPEISLTKPLRAQPKQCDAQWIHTQKCIPFSKSFFFDQREALAYLEHRLVLIWAARQKEINGKLKWMTA